LPGSSGRGTWFGVCVHMSNRTINRCWLAAIVLLLTGAACNKKDEEADRGAAPPPVASSKPGACATGGGTVGDATSAAFVPRAVGSYCVDPNGETRAYGENAPGSLDKVCTELFDGECEVYKTYGLKRVVTLRYVDGQGSPGAVNLNLSRFANRDSAYGFFTKRVVADADPKESAPEPLTAGGAGAIGTGIAYVWRGDYVAELSYTNDVESPDQIKQSSRRILPAIGQALGQAMPGETAPPPAVQALPEQHRIRLGVSYTPKDALDISGVGPGATGYYADGDKRWRVLSIVRADEESAKDVMKTLKRIDGGKTIKGMVNEASGFSLRDDEASPKAEWIVTRMGTKVLGVGDEPFALGGGAEDAKKNSLTATEKQELLTRLVMPGPTGKP
jgi:hypothetical protein